MKVIGYKILFGEFGELEAEVRAAIDEDWQPIGGICLKHDHDWDTVFYQAMVKYSEDESEMEKHHFSMTVNSQARDVASDFRAMEMMAS